ncbi:mandelate racemase [Rhodanobacter sp. Root480]|uniref:dipeptide epimerase n=1 Tax=unclassified Rhodanobacter TaxID=2621553 RepID=UPI0006FAACDD|nr:MULTISPECIES: dipeptide epimerase [unclassified Rhodanobacter]KQX98958.1 mandelate racemase [Rhodanobacter sp. Root480]KRA35107.1 mandelate racemase [Rhodanobacter sp. Root627]
MNVHECGRLRLQATQKSWAIKAPFHITGYTFTAFDALIVELTDEQGRTGRGEAQGVYYRHDTPATMQVQIEALRAQIEAGIDRQTLQKLLPAGGARNALDCALWDLEAKRSGKPVWQLAGLDTPRPLRTTYTLGAEEPEAMAEGAKAYAAARAIKLKLTDDGRSAERVLAVREARPDVWLMVDANQGFTRESFARLLPTLAEARVDVVEQPFPVGKEDWLDGLDRPIRVAADESVQDRGDLEKMVGRVDVINIKLDKCGGLTEALEIAARARKLGFDLMVGNMGGSSLAMAPAFVVGQLCDVVDLDGPISLIDDYAPSVVYEDGNVWCSDAVWGGA